MPLIIVDQPEALLDQPVEIIVEGFHPLETVDVSATRYNSAGEIWQRAWGRFQADEFGAIDLATSSPLAGTYNGACGMGLFWSMEEIDPPDEMPDVTEPVKIQLKAATVDMRYVAETTVWRLITGPGVIADWINEDGIVGRLFVPPGIGPHPAMITVTGSGGGIDRFAPALYASHGFATLALGYFGMEGLPPTLDAIPLEYFGRAISWLEQQPEVRSDFIGISGISRGGELALLLGATYSQIRAVVGLVPSGVVHGGLTTDGPAWTHGGEPVPWLQQDNKCTDNESIDWNSTPVATTPHFESSLRDSDAVKRSIIPVECINGPVLLVSGADDQMWPSTAMANLAIERLKEHQHPYDYEHLIYREAGHQIGPSFLPTMRRHSVHDILKTDFTSGGTAKADAQASMDAWPKIVAFATAAAKELATTYPDS